MKKVFALMIAAAGTSVFVSCGDAEPAADVPVTDSVTNVVEDPVVEPVVEPDTAVVDTAAGADAVMDSVPDETASTSM